MHAQTRQESNSVPALEEAQFTRAEFMKIVALGLITSAGGCSNLTEISTPESETQKLDRLINSFKSSLTFPTTFIPLSPLQEAALLEMFLTSDSILKAMGIESPQGASVDALQYRPVPERVGELRHEIWEIAGSAFPELELGTFSISGYHELVLKRLPAVLADYGVLAIPEEAYTIKSLILDHSVEDLEFVPSFYRVARVEEECVDFPECSFKKQTVYASGPLKLRGFELEHTKIYELALGFVDRNIVVINEATISDSKSRWLKTLERIQTESLGVLSDAEILERAARANDPNKVIASAVQKKLKLQLAKRAPDFSDMAEDVTRHEFAHAFDDEDPIFCSHFDPKSGDSLREILHKLLNSGAHTEINAFIFQLATSSTPEVTLHKLLSIAYVGKGDSELPESYRRGIPYLMGLLLDKLVTQADLFEIEINYKSAVSPTLQAMLQLDKACTKREAFSKLCLSLYETRHTRYSHDFAPELTLDKGIPKFLWDTFYGTPAGGALGLGATLCAALGIDSWLRAWRSASLRTSLEYELGVALKDEELAKRVFKGLQIGVPHKKFDLQEYRLCFNLALNAASQHEPLAELLKRFR